MKKIEGLPAKRDNLQSRLELLLIYLAPFICIGCLFLMRNSFAAKHGVNDNIITISIFHAFENPLKISFDLNVFTIGLTTFCILSFLITLSSMPKPYSYKAKAGDEQGSAKWNYNTRKYNRQYTFPKGESYSEITYKKSDIEEYIQRNKR